MSRLRIFRKSPTAVIGLIVVVLVVCSALLAPFISPYQPNDTDLYARMKAPSRAHPMGTDKLGRDVLSRIIWGARVSLAASSRESDRLPPASPGRPSRL